MVAFNPWKHQEFVEHELEASLAAGERRILIAGPTGCGKSYNIVRAVENGDSAILYTVRRLLTEQLRGTFEEHGLSFGIRAAGYEEEYLRLGRPIQISSIQTEQQRVYTQKKRTLHRCGRVVVDEAHMQAGGTAQKIFADHLADGAAIIGFTATPMGIYQKPYTKLIVAASNSELRACGAHLPCLVFAPDEPELDRIKPTATGEYAEGEIVRKIWTPAIMGRVLTHYRMYNPEMKHAICCCPSVATAVWMAEEFTKAGIPSASLDGEEIVCNGVREVSDVKSRKRLMERFDAGEIKVITFRYVLREAWDFPQLYHLILATPIGSLTSYLQVVGRVLRNHHTLDHVIVQDHGGNYWRHGSPNANRDWHELWKLKEHVPSELRLERLREKKELEPITCPKCKAVRLRGVHCHHCGHQSSRKTREILQHDGKLREVSGDIVRPRRTKQREDTETKWVQCYHRCQRAGMTFRQAEGLFYRENFYYPPRTLALMPRNDHDWFAPIKAVGKERLL